MSTNYNLIKRLAENRNVVCGSKYSVQGRNRKIFAKIESFRMYSTHSWTVTNNDKKKCNSPGICRFSSF